MSTIKNPEWVGVYTMDGSLVRVYPTIKIASIELGVTPLKIKKSMKGDISFLNEQIVLAYDYSKTIPDIQSEIELRRNKIEKKKTLRPIFQYDKKGNFIREYTSIVEAVKYIPVSQAGISLCIKGSIKTVNNCIVLRAKDESEDSRKEIEIELKRRIEFIKKKEKGQRNREEISSTPEYELHNLAKNVAPIQRPKRKHLVDIYHFEKNGSFVQMFPNVREIFNVLGVSSPTIRNVCMGKTEICTYGIFLLTADYPTIDEAQKEATRRVTESKIKASKRTRRSFEVCQFKKDGTLIGTYSSSKIASQSLQINHSQINRALKGYTKTIGGFIFLYSKDYVNEDDMAKEVLERQHLSIKQIQARMDDRNKKQESEQ